MTNYERRQAQAAMSERIRRFGCLTATGDNEPVFLPVTIKQVGSQMDSIIATSRYGGTCIRIALLFIANSSAPVVLSWPSLHLPWKDHKYWLHVPRPNCSREEPTFAISEKSRVANPWEEDFLPTIRRGSPFQLTLFFQSCTPIPSVYCHGSTVLATLVFSDECERDIEVATVVWVDRSAKVLVPRHKHTLWEREDGTCRAPVNLVTPDERRVGLSVRHLGIASSGLTAGRVGLCRLIPGPA